MALTNQERQARWRAKHPEKAAARLAALAESKRSKRCEHDPQRCREIAGEAIRVWICHDCGGLLFSPSDLDDYCDLHGIRKAATA